MPRAGSRCSVRTPIAGLDVRQRLLPLAGNPHILESTCERLRRSLGSLPKLDVPLRGLLANGSVASGDAAYSSGSLYGYASRGKR